MARRRPRLRSRLLALLLLMVAVAYGGLRATAGGGHTVAPALSRGASQVRPATATDQAGAHRATGDGVGTVPMPGGRGYVLLRPTGVTGPLPLLVLLHGTDVSAATEMGFTGFSALARNDRFLLAAPQSVGPTWNSRNGCCGAPARDHLDDTHFVAAVIADVRRRADVDPRRIYLVGYSAGGKLSYDVACALPRTFAATATYGAGPQLPCRSAVPRPVFVGYGLRDTLEPIVGKPHNNRGEHQSAASTVTQLRALDSCAAADTVRTVGPATIDTWTDCVGQTAVEYVRWAGQSHTFPTASHVPAAATAATLMWQFFAAYGCPDAATDPRLGDTVVGDGSGATRSSTAPVPVATKAAAGSRT